MPSESLEADDIKRRHAEESENQEIPAADIEEVRKSRLRAVTVSSYDSNTVTSFGSPGKGISAIEAEGLPMETSSSSDTLKIRKTRPDRSHTVSQQYHAKKFRFNEQVLVGETWGKGDYDRRADNTLRLTPQLAQQIKQELNEYKVMEMAVHEDSRHNTHLLM